MAQNNIPLGPSGSIDEQQLSTFNSWFKETLEQVKPDLVVAIARDLGDVHL